MQRFTSSLLFCAASLMAVASACGFTLTPSASASLGFDSNPLGSSGTTAPLLGGADTLTYSAGAGLGLTQPGPTAATIGKLAYAVEAWRFERYPDENHATHRLTASHQAELGAGKILAEASSLFIAGADENPVALTAINANSIPLWRERRRQWQHRAKLQAETRRDAWVLRGGLTWLAYDYRTQNLPGKFTLADRADTQLLLDGGWQQNAGSQWFVGVRPGWQRQALVPLPHYEFEYSNSYWKLAAGWTGRLGRNTTVTFAGGPDYRHYTGAINPLIFGDRHRTSLWFEGGFTTQAGPRLRLSGKAVRLNWLSSTGQSAYTDSSAEFAATLKFAPAWDLRVTGKVHQCDYFPTQRDDWELLLGVGLTVQITPRVTLSADLFQQEAWNALRGVAEREFSRCAGSLGASFRF